MMHTVNFKKCLRPSYPVGVFLVGLLEWTFTSQAKDRVDFKIPKMNGPDWRAPVSSRASCTQKPEVHSCQSTVKT
jgi:hypothetical protein